MLKLSKTKEILDKATLSEEYISRIDEEYAAQAAELLNFKTFQVVDATARILDDGNSRHVEVIVKSMITGETISFDSKTFLAMNPTTKDMIDMDGLLCETDFVALLSKVKLQMSCGLETVKVDHLPFYPGITSEKSCKQYYKDFVFDMIYGLIASSSCFLSEISRSLKEDITLKATEKRLSRNLEEFNN